MYYLMIFTCLDLSIYIMLLCVYARNVRSQTLPHNVFSHAPFQALMTTKTLIQNFSVCESNLH